MTAAKHDFIVTQATTWDDVLELREETEQGPLLNLSGAAARLTIRTANSLTASELADLTAGNGLTLGGAAGTITISRTGAQTAAWAANTYWYTLNVTFSDATTRPILAGRVFVNPSAAQPA